MEIKKRNNKSTSWVGLDEELLVRQYFESRHLGVPTRLGIEEFADNLTSCVEVLLKSCWRNRDLMAESVGGGTTSAFSEVSGTSFEAKNRRSYAKN